MHLLYMQYTLVRELLAIGVAGIACVVHLRELLAIGDAGIACVVHLC